MDSVAPVVAGDRVTPPSPRQLRTTRGAPGDLDRAVALKGDTTISLILPARNEQATIGDVVTALRTALTEHSALVDELVVVDDSSTDRTAELAGRAGARVVRTCDLLPEGPTDRGKGGALWSGVAATSGDLVVFLDADVVGLPAHWVASLVLPLLLHPEICLVKAAYDRPLEVDGVVHPGSGGRVTRLLARPVLGLVAPELTQLAQPLAGETAARRELLEQLPFAGGYGVEIGLLLDTWTARGTAAIAQVDLGTRAHRHQSDEALAAMASAVLHVAAERAGWRIPDGPPVHHVLTRQDDSYEPSAVPLHVANLPLLGPKRCPSS